MHLFYLTRLTTCFSIITTTLLLSQIAPLWANQISRVEQYQGGGNTVRFRVIRAARNPVSLRNRVSIPAYQNRIEGGGIFSYISKENLLAQKSQDLKAEANRLYDQGYEAYSSRQYDKAKEFLNRALVIYQDIGAQESIGDTLNILGAVFNNLGQYQKALNLYKQALAISQANDTKEARETSADILNNIGLIYKSRGEYYLAVEYYQQSLALQEKIDNKTGIGHSLNSLGAVYYEMGQYIQALKFYQQALTKAQSGKNRIQEGNILNNIGLIYSQLGQYSKALTVYQEVLSIRKETKDKVGEGTTLHNVGFVYNKMKNHKQALNFYQQALSIFREIGSLPKIGNTLNNIGLTYHELKQDSQALEFLEKALTTLQQVGERSFVGRTFDSMGTVYKDLGKSSQALGLYQQALAISREIGDRPGERETLSNIGNLFALQKKSELAIVFYKQSVNVTEAIRSELRSLPQEQQKSYTETIADTYRHLADLLLQQDRVLEAQQVLDLLKVQELDDYFHDVRGNEQTSQGVDVLPLERKINEGLKVISHQQIQISQKLTQLQKIPSEQRKPEEEQKIIQLQAEILDEFNQFIESPEVTAWLEQLSPKTRDQVIPLSFLNGLQDNLQRLNQNAVLLYPLVLENRLELVLTTPNTPPIHRSVSVTKKELNQAILDFREALAKNNSDATVPAQKLYEWLIKPIEKDLASADTKTILYAPDGPLRYIPLAALYDGKQWLVQRFAINYITAFSLTELNTQPLPKIKILAGATTQRHIVPVESTSFHFNALKFAGVEVENLARMMPGTKMLLDDKFSRQGMIPYLKDYTMIHMATHAKFISGEPELSFILMGDGGVITLPDLKRLSLPNVDLVILSACETAVGKQMGQGEEILGFGYQVQRTGARSAIASLWAVDDGGTQALMNAFYALLNQGKITKVEALRQAQIALITGDYSGIEQQKDSELLKTIRNNLPSQVVNRLNHPYYWSPFILIGNGL
jgi:CHAT domain-containing protein/Tfp pilus assembly protein PilF